MEGWSSIYKFPICIEHNWATCKTPSWMIIPHLGYTWFYSIDVSTYDTTCAQVQANFQCLDGDFVSQNGYDIDAILAGLAEAKALTGKGKPVCILLHTEMGNGVDFMMNTHAWHGVAPNDEQLKNALNQNPETLGDY